MRKILASLYVIVLSVGISYADVSSKKVTELPVTGAVIATSDGGILLNVLRGIVKMDSTGSVAWQRGVDANIYMLAEYPGGYLAGGEDVIYAFDHSGNLLWSKSFDFSPDFSYTYVYGAFWMGGTFLTWFRIYSVSNSRYMSSLVALDSTGNVLWGKTYDMVAHDMTVGSGYLYMVGADSLDTLVVVKMNLSGNVVWARSYGRYVYRGRKTVGVASLGNRLFITTTNGDILKLSSSDGSVVWVKSSDMGFSTVSTDGSYIYLVRNQIAKLDTLGNLIWSKEYNTDSAYNSVFEDSDALPGYLLVYGDLNYGSDTALLIKVPTSNGALSCSRDFPISLSDLSPTSTSFTLASGSVAPTVTSGPSTSAVSVGIYDACTPVGINEAAGSSCSEVLAVYDVSGRKVSLGKRKGVFFVKTTKGIKRVIVR